MGKNLLTFFIIIAGSAILVWFLRFNVHLFCFQGKSKSAQKKIKKAQPFGRKLLMTYAMQYNNRALTVWAVICYYVFCLCSIVWLCDLFLYMISAARVPFIFLRYALKAWMWLPLLSAFSLLFRPRSKPKRTT